ncbi:dihydrolipoyl dehydrogenase [Bacteriovoracaceae bacterium]|nr:dihydrolipoyl dehydrogenase [Bacteriovoracaceae bacterium]
MSQEFDVVVIGGGPGGYIAAIRASQLGKKVALVEKEHLGGVCLNKGCIPTKALLKSAHSVHEVKQLSSLGINVELKDLDGTVAVKRANQIASKISKGVGYLMKKNKITVIDGSAEFISANEIKINHPTQKSTQNITAKKFIIATGANYRQFPGLVHDGENLLGAWEAVKLETLPNKIGIIGAGAIGMEFAYFWSSFGVEVQIFELQKNLLPLEDEDVSKEIERAYKKYGIKFFLGVEKVSAESSNGKTQVKYVSGGKEQAFDCDKVLIAVGMQGNTENLGLEKIGIKVDRTFIETNEFQQTNLKNIYAIGDVAGPPLLAHVASHEGIIAAEHLSDKKPHPIDPLNIPACTYCQPQVASVGLTEKKAKELGLDFKVGKIPFSANGKAIASNESVGFIKTLIGKNGEMLGAHIIGTVATELIHEYTLFKTMEGVDEEIFGTIHPHPTLGEFLAEAVLAAHGRTLNF